VYFAPHNVFGNVDVDIIVYHLSKVSVGASVWWLVLTRNFQIAVRFSLVVFCKQP